MFNVEVANVTEQPLALYQGSDVVAAAENILRNETFQDLANLALASLDAMNRQFATLSADDQPESGHTEDQLSALTNTSLTIDTLSADSHIRSARQAVSAQAVARDRMVRFLLDEEDE